MKKMKRYVKPELQVVASEPISLMAASPSYADENEKPGDLYDEIETGNGSTSVFD